MERPGVVGALSEIAVDAPLTRVRGLLPAWVAHPVSVGFVLFLLGCSQRWVGLLGYGIGDILVYDSNGRQVVHGLVPYRDFSFDWPPGAVVPITLPALSPGAYDIWFKIACVAYLFAGLVLGYGILRRLGVDGRRLRLATWSIAILPAALGGISISSFDAFPALLTVAALAALLGGHDRLGLALLGAGIVTKVYPVVLVPLALVWIARRRGRGEALRGLGICSGVVALVAAPFALLGFHGLETTTLEQARRGLQMESLGASVLMSLHHLGLAHLHVVVGKPYSLDVVGTGAGAAITLSNLLVLLSAAAVWGAFAAGPAEPRRLVVASAAAVAGWIAFNHVLSPQFLVWLFPLVPLVAAEAAGVLGTLVLFAACLTTMTWFPGRFWQLAAVGSVSWFALLRNLLLVVLFGVLLTPLLRSLRSRGVAARPA